MAPTQADPNGPTYRALVREVTLAVLALARHEPIPAKTLREIEHKLKIIYGEEPISGE